MPYRSPLHHQSLESVLNIMQYEAGSSLLVAVCRLAQWECESWGKCGWTMGYGWEEELAFEWIDFNSSREGSLLALYANNAGEDVR